MPTSLMAFEQILALAEGALRGCGVSAANAASVAHSIACAERDGQAIVGLSYLPTYCDHAACGKVDGQAQPTLAHRSPVALHVDAAGGFAHPALALGLAPLALAARSQGVAVLAVGNSYACGSLGYFVEQLAAQGLVALMAANASPSIAPWGGKRPFFGTNPIAFGVPRAGRPPFIIDQSSSTVARVAVLDAHRRGVPLPEGWALDAEGQPTQDPQAAMKGSMMPLGGYKGAGLALMVDVLAAGLTGAHYSHEVSSFGDTSGGPPCSGQLVVAFDPERLRGPGFADALERMLQAMQEGPGVRLPGDRRLEARARHASGVTIDDALIATLQRYAVQGSSAAPGGNLVPIIGLTRPTTLNLDNSIVTTKPRLIYFDFAGSRGEECRIALHLAGIDFDDVRVTSADWPARKSQTPFGSMPVLELAGHPPLGESNAILVYIGRQYGLHPKDDLEAAYHEALMSHAEELRHHVGPVLRISDEAHKRSAREDLARNYLPDWGSKVERQLRGYAFVGGDQIQVVDIKLYMVVRWLTSAAIDHVPTSVLDHCPKLLRLFRQVEEHPGVKAWLERASRPAD